MDFIGRIDGEPFEGGGPAGLAELGAERLIRVSKSSSKALVPRSREVSR